jgi:GTP cyclohydrolase II
LDTIEANLRLGHPVDARDYALPVAVLAHLGIRSLRLITNNPDKIAAVRAAGIEIRERVSAEVPPNFHSAEYLATKRSKLGHLLSVEAPFAPAERSSAGMGGPGLLQG